MVNKKSILATFFIFGILIMGFVWADSNGVWHRAEDVPGGVFGSDEVAQTTDYTFVNPVKFNSTVEINTIKSNSASVM